MKKSWTISTTLVVLCFLCFGLSAQIEETELKAVLANVTIHLQGAEMVQSVKVPVKQGRQRYVFTGLSPKLKPQSIQVTANNGVSILSITSKINFLKQNVPSPAVRAIKDSIDISQAELQRLVDEQAAFEEERDLLQKNKSLSGKDASLPVDELKKAADFYQQRFKEINFAVSALKKRQAKLNADLQRFNRQTTQLSANNQPTSEVYVDVESDGADACDFRLRYLVDDAGWSPVYDLVSVGLDEPIVLKYRALAFNKSGIDWEDVKIRLSTADPNQGAGQPVLSPWVLGSQPQLAQEITGNNLTRPRSNQLDLNQQSQNMYNFSHDLNPDLATESVNVVFETIEISELSKDFDIAAPYSIPSDGRPYSIDIAENKLAATYKHFVVPKLDRDAFLLAQITGWESLDLISGPMNVYRNENFIGVAQLSTRTLSDTLELSLGRDANVLVTKEKLKDFSKKQLFGGNKISSFSYKISVKNNHRQAISIEVQDQVPVSSTKEIEVEVKEVSNARYIKESGKLVWEINLPAGEVKQVQIGFTIKHPLSMEVQMDKSRTVVSPRYF